MVAGNTARRGRCSASSSPPGAARFLPCLDPAVWLACWTAVSGQYVSPADTFISLYPHPLPTPAHLLWPPPLPCPLPLRSGLSLAESAGLRQSDVIEVVKLGAIACPMFALKVRSTVRRRAMQGGLQGGSTAVSISSRKAVAADALLLAKCWSATRISGAARCCCCCFTRQVCVASACSLASCRAPGCPRAPTRPPSRSSTSKRT